MQIEAQLVSFFLKTFKIFGIQEVYVDIRLGFHDWILTSFDVQGNILAIFALRISALKGLTT